MSKSTTNFRPTPWGYLAINALMALLFIKELTSLWVLHLNAQFALSSNILSDDSAALLEKIHQSDPAWWVWAMMGLSLAITVFLLIGWWVPKLSWFRPWFARLSLIWFSAWAIYLVIIFIRTALAINRIFA